MRLPRPSATTLPMLVLAYACGVEARAHAEETLFTEASSRRPAAIRNLTDFVRLSRQLGPAVVNIVCVTAAPEAPAEEGAGSAQSERPRRSRGQGTGVIIQRDGYILTNTHVVEGASDIRVRLSDERELSARLVGKDDRTDIALLKIEAGGPLQVAVLGDSDHVEIGEWVIAIGNPFGLDHTVTAGIVSAKGRRDVRPGGSRTGFYDFIQTDASINPGNSGGPLINTRGEVIGINTAMNAQAQGIGFAIPINMTKVIVPLLRKHGRVPRSWLGIYPQSVTASLKRAFGLPDAHGALVSEVVADSPAARAGLIAGDVILRFDGRSVRRSDDLMWLVATTPAGRKVPMDVVRAGRRQRLELQLESSPDEAPPPAPVRAVAPRRSPLGMTVSEISPSIARELKNPSLRGVIVMTVEPDSPAVEAGLERGDLIVRIGDAEVSNLDDYARTVRAVAHGEILKMLVRRDGHNLWVAFLKR